MFSGFEIILLNLKLFLLDPSETEDDNDSDRDGLFELYTLSVIPSNYFVDLKYFGSGS